MMRIGIDGHILTGKFQGSRTYLLNLLRQLGEHDTENRYIIYSFDPPQTRALLAFGHFEHRRIAIRPAIPRLLVYWPWEHWRSRLDVLLTSYFTPLIYRRRQIVIVHDLLYETHRRYFGRLAGLRFRLLVRHCAERAGAVVVVSETTREQLLARYNVPPPRVHLVRGGIDRALHRVDPDRAPPPYAPYVLAVGRLEPRKNVPGLLRAFRLLRTQGCRLVVIGREDFAAAGIAADLRATPGVVWLQHVPDADLPWYYRHAAVFAFPSFAEGFGLPVLEALVQGTPVVASGHAAMREVGGPFARYFDAEAADADSVLARLLDDALQAGRPPVAPALSAHLAGFDWAQSAASLQAVINDRRAPRAAGAG